MKVRVLAAVVAVLMMSGALVGAVVDEADAKRQDGAVDPEVGQSASYGDRALIAALDGADLTTAWVDTTTMAPATALAELRGGPAYQAARQTLIDGLIAYADDRDAAVAERNRLDELVAATDAVADQVRVLRLSAAAGEPAEGRVLATAVNPLRMSDRHDDAARSRVGWSLELDPVQLAESRLETIHHQLTASPTRAEVAGLSGDARADKAEVAQVIRLTEAHRQLLELADFLGSLRQRLFGAELELVARRSALVDSMDQLAQARVLAATSVEGLPTVTLDAYVRAAATLDPGCPVDWTLLAGIGRVESFHGTIDGASVQSNGRISETILGPLLDGGATEREAREAREAEAQAEAEAEAEAQAELDAEAAARQAREELLFRDLYGPREQADPEPTPVAAEEGDVEAPSGFDPLLWGPQGSDETDAAESDAGGAEEASDTADGDSDDSDEVPELRGNGFAVITDTDNGRLDGNARWDRAVGPMQFIPETWAYWGSDGNGDDVTDPHNLYDAAAGAGRFLCHLSRTRGPSPRSFVLGYNQSDAYVSAVLDHAARYGSKSLPTIPD